MHGTTIIQLYSWNLGTRTVYCKCCPCTSHTSSSSSEKVVLLLGPDVNAAKADAADAGVTGLPFLLAEVSACTVELVEAWAPTSRFAPLLFASARLLWQRRPGRSWSTPAIMASSRQDDILFRTALRFGLSLQLLTTTR